MRNLAWFLSLLGAALVGIFVLLPILGIVILFVAGLLAVVAVGVLAAPLLTRLPWFRNRFTVRRQGGFRTVRFGNSVFMSYSDTSEPVDPEPESDPLRQLETGDVIDVEGKEIPPGKE